jgi:23S rRNA (uracil1939-C5)-methyltransferase
LPPVRVEIKSLGGGGRGVTRAGRKVWFVAGALPGETVEAEVERERAGIVEARAVKVLKASRWRDPDPCPVAGPCGGCDLAHVRREFIADALREITAGALRHAPPQLTEAIRGAPVVVSEMGWRLRARLHWEAATKTLGFRGPRTHRTADISPCRVISRLLLDGLPRLSRALAEAGLPDGDVEWLENLGPSGAVAGWRGPGTPPEVSVRGLAGWHPIGEGGALLSGGWGATGVTMELPTPLRVPVGAFFQANRHLVPRLFDRVSELVRAHGHARVVDLYGGVGFFAAAARRAGAAAITVVESSRVAADAAAMNLPGVLVLAVSAEDYLEDPGTGSGTLAILDPPRVGLSATATEGLLRWLPAGIVLLSCDAAHFGRDAAQLLAFGYKLASLELWDLFAGSHHVEILADFRRQRG